MNFNVLKATSHISKWQNANVSVTLSFELIPDGREYLDIGDEYILSASSYLPLRDKARKPIDAHVNFTSNPDALDHIKGERPICGYADFLEERQRDFETTPAALYLTIAVAPELLERMLALRANQPGDVTFNAWIEGLEYGWEPDGSHQIWKLDDDRDAGFGMRRRITSYDFKVETFWCSEDSIRKAADRKFNERLSDSPNPEDRELAASLRKQITTDNIPQLLRHCRTILILLLIVGALILLRITR